MLVTGGVLHEQVNVEVKLQFVDYLYQLEQFGKIKIKRNYGFFKDPRQAILMVYFDAGEAAEEYVMHLLYETNTRGQFQAEFLFSANALVPTGRNIPHAEIDSAFRATRQTTLVLDWLSNFVVSKALLGDSQVSLY